MKAHTLFCIAIGGVLISCDSKEKAAEERRQDTAKQWNDATKDLAEKYKLPEPKARRMTWGKPDSEAKDKDQQQSDHQ